MVEKIEIFCKYGHSLGRVDYERYVKNYRKFSYFCEKCYINKIYGGEKTNMVKIDWKISQKEIKIDEGIHTAICSGVNFVSPQASRFGREYLRWGFVIDGVNMEFVGSTSVNFSDTSKAGRWALAILGHKAEDTDELVGKKCKILLSYVQGRTESKILVVKDVFPYKPETKKKK